MSPVSGKYHHSKGNAEGPHKTNEIRYLPHYGGRRCSVVPFLFWLHRIINAGSKSIEKLAKDEGVWHYLDVHKPHNKNFRAYTSSYTRRHQIPTSSLWPNSTKKPRYRSTKSSKHRYHRTQSTKSGQYQEQSAKDGRYQGQSAKGGQFQEKILDFRGRTADIGPSRIWKTSWSSRKCKIPPSSLSSGPEDAARVLSRPIEQMPHSGLASRPRATPPAKGRSDIVSGLMTSLARAWRGRWLNIVVENELGWISDVNRC